MACEKCEQAGKAPKIIHFQRCGRWETRVFCEHTYQRAGLRSHNPRFGQRDHLTHAVKDERRIRRRPTKNADRIAYSAEMDKFILARYGSKGRWVRTNSYGKGEMKVLAKDFGEKFGIANVRPNQLIGRWNRLRQLTEPQREEVREVPEEEVREVPSLPVLKFMQHGV